MSNQMSARQQAQQGNRTRDGRYDFGASSAVAGEASVELDGARPYASWEPSRVDGELAETLMQLERAKGVLRSRLDALHRQVGDSRSYDRVARDHVWARTDDDVYGQAGETERVPVDAAREAIDDLLGTANELRDEFRSRPWNRAYLVNGVDGHVHSSTDCPTCNRLGKQTSFSWMTEYSGASEDEIVADAGWRACSTCYPSAPVGDEDSLPTKMFTADDLKARQAREERAAAKVERDAKKLAAALTPDGSEFEVRTEPLNPNAPAWSGREKFKTERAATLWAVDHMAWMLVERLPHREEANRVRDESVTRIIEAIATKHDRDPAEVRAELVAKAEKKARKFG